MQYSRTTEPGRIFDIDVDYFPYSIRNKMPGLWKMFFYNNNLLDCITQLELAVLDGYMALSIHACHGVPLDVQHMPCCRFREIQS